MPTARTYLALPVTVGLGVLLTLAGCGSKTPTISSGGAPASSGSTVSVSNVGGQSVLVDQAGVALYANDQDSGTQPRCITSDCLAIWTPLTVPAGSKPTAGSGVSGTLATIKRPDGSQQVTLNGKLLYSFSFDHGAGRDTGDNARDDFGGTSFTWHNALTAAGVGTPAAPATSAPGGYNTGGY